MNILLVVDLQEEFSDSENYLKVLQYVREERKDFDKIIGTVFVNSENSRFVKDLNFEKCKDANEESLKYNADIIIKKDTYAIDIDKYVNKEKDTIYIVGCDSDACVMATAFLLFDKGYDFIIKSEYIYTTSKTFSNEQVVEILKRNFGKRVE